MLKGRSILFIVFILLVGCSSAKGGSNQTELTISAAASLKNVLEEIIAEYEKNHHNVQIKLNVAASGTLSKQIEQGAPVDLFFSADIRYFDTLVEKGYIIKQQSHTLLQNELVVIASKQSNVHSGTDIQNVQKLAIGMPDTVPAGRYAKETLVNLKLWNRMIDKIITAKDVRQVLSYVETGNVDAGIVYKTDAQTSSKVKIISDINPNLHTPIVYPIGVVTKSTKQKESEKFYTYLLNEQSKKVFEKYRFTIAE
ncbi:molybdate ABC transporter substrate-binding protein [Metabacillus malikii]|uniref:Molybdate transport system substrate-binding protein n=1 Tax=Metabacillus malikii TaxID=1504265 RepID=A0ABT9ZCI4_9BACI|nr:molybdate ABC transporter substrate-binding protein [Metabacillus malikii]MDQ0229552.1 molybdate transport system substrate-binding protein [Metabacillus malikii]